MHLMIRGAMKDRPRTPSNIIFNTFFLIVTLLTAVYTEDSLECQGGRTCISVFIGSVTYTSLWLNATWRLHLDTYFFFLFICPIQRETSFLSTN